MTVFCIIYPKKVALPVHHTAFVTAKLSSMISMKHHPVSSVLPQRPFSHPVMFPSQTFPKQPPIIAHFCAALNTSKSGPFLGFFIPTQWFLKSLKIPTFFSSCTQLPSYAQFQDAFAQEVIHVRDSMLLSSLETLS